MIYRGSPEFRRRQRDVVEQRRCITRQQLERVCIVRNDLHDDVIDIGDHRRQDRSRDTKRKCAAVRMAIEDFRLACTHQQGIALAQFNIAATGRDRGFAV